MSTNEVPIITIVGSLNIDLSFSLSRIPEAGETLSANQVMQGPGGKGANQAVACARLSRSKNDIKNGTAMVRMCGCIGQDAYGKILEDSLSKAGIDVSSLSSVEAQTGVAIIMVEESTGQNRIILNSGANESLTKSGFLQLLGPMPNLIILQLEIPLETVLEVIDVARERGIQVLLNPAPALALPDRAYKGLTHLILNESEAATLTQRSIAELDHDSILPIIAQTFHDRGVQNVIITLGSRGVFYSAQRSLQTGHVKANKVHVVDTTAAGDTFVGAYALEAIKSDFQIEAAVRRANRAAAITVQRKGAQNSIPWLDEVETMSF